MVRASALAILRLIKNSSFVGCSTGKSPSLAPFSILSTKVGPRRTLLLGQLHRTGAHPPRTSLSTTRRVEDDVQASFLRRMRAADRRVPHHLWSPLAFRPSPLRQMPARARQATALQMYD